MTYCLPNEKLSSVHQAKGETWSRFFCLCMVHRVGFYNVYTGNMFTSGPTVICRSGLASSAVICFWDGSIQNIRRHLWLLSAEFMEYGLTALGQQSKTHLKLREGPSFISFSSHQVWPEVSILSLWFLLNTVVLFTFLGSSKETLHSE